MFTCKLLFAVYLDVPLRLLVVIESPVREENDDEDEVFLSDTFTVSLGDLFFLLFLPPVNEYDVELDILDGVSSDAVR